MIYFISKGSVFESGVPAEMREAWRVSNSPSPVWLTVRATAPLGADQVALYLGADECNPGAKAIFDSLEFKSFPVGVPRGELGLQPNLWTADPGRDPVARTWDPERFPSLRATSGPRSLNLLDRIAHVPAERNQVRSGTCGVWALTALVELEMARKYGIKDRLSVQYYESNKDRSFYPKSEDLFSDFANFYKFSKILIPWANPNAEFRSTHGFEEKIEHHTPVIGDPHYKLLDLEFGELFEPSSMHDHTATIEA